MDVRTTRRGVPLTELGFGTAPLAGLFTPVSEEQAAAALDAAWDAGFRYFDTAPHYGLGLAERRLGAALAARPRDEVVVSTKVGRLLVPNPGGEGRLDDDGFAVPADVRREFDFSRDGVLRSLEASLTRLGLDRVDIVYLHDPDQHWQAASTTGVDALVELRDQGVVRAIGAGMNQSAMLTEFVRRTDIDLVLVAGRYTLLEQGALDDLLPAAAERGVEVVAGAIYNSGLLSRPRPADDATYDYAPVPADVRNRVIRLAEACEAAGTTLPAAATRFPLRNPQVVSAVLGLRSPEEVAEAVHRATATVPDALWPALAGAGLIDPREGTR
ncbi:MAG TPA: aldo/keto reductase [Amnibacterium sp.]|jgi:D-threo-aldose 1-dehydrogenase|nr:aldo/keto reductase [Amnibacterium sp.]